MNDFIITSIFGLIFLGIGLAIRFKIRSDNKKGIFHEDTYNGSGFPEEHSDSDNYVNPATGCPMLDGGFIDSGGNTFGTNDNNW